MHRYISSFWLLMAREFGSNSKRYKFVTQFCPKNKMKKRKVGNKKVKSCNYYFWLILGVNFNNWLNLVQKTIRLWVLPRRSKKQTRTLVSEASQISAVHIPYGKTLLYTKYTKYIVKNSFLFLLTYWQSLWRAFWADWHCVDQLAPGPQKHCLPSGLNTALPHTSLLTAPVHTAIRKDGMQG